MGGSESQPGRPEEEMKNGPLAVLSILCLSLAPALWAQRHGGQSHGGQRQGPSATSQQQGGQRGGAQQHDRQRTQTQARQQTRYQDCLDAASQARTQAQEISKRAKGKSFDADQARWQRDRLREHVRIMEQEHERVMQGVTQEQRERMEKRIREMDQSRERIETQLKAMDQELSGDPDRDRIAEQARETAKAIKDWQKNYRVVAREAGLNL